MSSLRECVLGRGGPHLLFKGVLSGGGQRGIAHFLIPDILKTALVTWTSMVPKACHVLPSLSLCTHSAVA